MSYTRTLIRCATLVFLLLPVWAEGGDQFEIHEYAGEDCRQEAFLSSSSGQLPGNHVLHPKAESVLFTKGRIGLVVQQRDGANDIHMLGDNSNSCMDVLEGATTLELYQGNDPIEEDDEDWDGEPMILSEDELAGFMGHGWDDEDNREDGEEEEGRVSISDGDEDDPLMEHQEL